MSATTAMSDTLSVHTPPPGQVPRSHIISPATWRPAPVAGVQGVSVDKIEIEDIFLIKTNRNEK